MANTEKIKYLKKLIEGSASFSDLQKESLIAKIPELNSDEVEAAIRIFKEEIDEWKGIYEEYQARKSDMKEYLTESKRELKNMTQECVRKAEQEEQTENTAQLEDLLNTLN